MTNNPIDLDTKRSVESKKETSLRRQSIRAFEVGQRILRRRQKELNAQLRAAPAANWPEAAIKARYLIRRYAKTAEALDARHRKLIQRTLGDLERLLELEGRRS